MFFGWVLVYAGRQEREPLAMPGEAAVPGGASGRSLGLWQACLAEGGSLGGLCGWGGIVGRGGGGGGCVWTSSALSLAGVAFVCLGVGAGGVGLVAYDGLVPGDAHWGSGGGVRGGDLGCDRCVFRRRGGSRCGGGSCSGWRGWLGGFSWLVRWGSRGGGAGAVGLSGADSSGCYRCAVFGWGCWCWVVVFGVLFFCFFFFLRSMLDGGTSLGRGLACR